MASLAFFDLELRAWKSGLDVPCSIDITPIDAVAEAPVFELRAYSGLPGLSCHVQAEKIEWTLCLAHLHLRVLVALVPEVRAGGAHLPRFRRGRVARNVAVCLLVDVQEEDAIRARQPAIRGLTPREVQPCQSSKEQESAGKLSEHRPEPRPLAAEYATPEKA